MKLRRGARRGYCSASCFLLLGWLLVACAPRVQEPAPVISGGVSPAERGPERITVQRGQTLSEIAHSYHVPMRVIAEANGLTPPYRIQIGRTLTIPGVAPPRIAAMRPSVAALPPTQPPETPPPAAPTNLATPAPDRPPVVSAPPVPSAAPPETELAVESMPPPRAAPETAPDSSRAAPPPPTRSGGAFLWPVRGHVLANYGSKSDGTHNDGINIAAPRGAAVQAVDGGVVAYTGNELRGYGNLVLIKHPNGWISAYAHCDQILVKRGDKVGRGEVIARVGSTGNVSEPQLHFELRRGQRPVDPREFLPPLPTAATAATGSS